MLSHKFLRNRKSPKARKCNVILIMISILFFLIFIICYVVNQSINKAIFYQAKIISTNVLSQTTQKILENIKIDYDKIVSTKKDNTGKIISIET
ncbi:MAG: hypothetical protein RSA79_06865, partial [Oscillospiraceae bacterium]